MKRPLAESLTLSSPAWGELERTRPENLGCDSVEGSPVMTPALCFLVIMCLFVFDQGVICDEKKRMM